MSGAESWLDVMPPLHPFPLVPVLVDGHKEGILKAVDGNGGVQWMICLDDGSRLAVTSNTDFRYNLDTQMGFLYCLWLAGRTNDYSIIRRFFYENGIDTDRKLLSLAYGAQPTDKDRLTLAKLLQAGQRT